MKKRWTALLILSFTFLVFVNSCAFYVAPPRRVGVVIRPSAVWVPGHYAPRGRWVHGHWR